jgi:thiamine transporter
MEKMTKHDRLVRLATSAILIALAAALSNVKIFSMPLGGSITLLSMLPVCLISLKYGVRWGLACAFLYALTQILFDLGSIMSWGLTTASFVGCIVLDYLLPFSLLGLSGIFGSETLPRICTGITLALVIRFVCHVISGVIIFDIWAPEGWNVLAYSLAYNGAVILPEIALTLIGSMLLFKVPATRKRLVA